MLLMATLSKTLRKEAKRHRIKIIATIYENINTKRKKN
jgi:hypothetical protein